MKCGKIASNNALLAIVLIKRGWTGVIYIQGISFELVEDYRNGWNTEAFRERYNEILNKYDYIVGDWGYGQLRLRGFYEDSNQKAAFDARISTLDEYINEYCNFGCPYFVLKKVKNHSGKSVQPGEFSVRDR